MECVFAHTSSDWVGATDSSNKLANESSVVKLAALGATVDDVTAAVVVDTVSSVVAALLPLLPLPKSFNAGVPKLLGTLLVEDSKFSTTVKVSFP